MFQNVPDGSVVQTYSSFNFSNIFGAQIRNIINNLTKKNFKTSCVELKHIKELYGEEATSFILRTLVESLDLKEPKPQEKSKSPTSKDNAKLQLLSQEINELSAHSKFATHLLRAFQNINISVSLISSLCELLHLPLAQELAVGLAFTQSPETSVQQKGTKFLKMKLDDIQQNSISYDSLPEQLLHNLLFFMRTQEEGFSKQLNNVLKVLSLQKNQITPDTPLTLSSVLGSTNGVDSKWNIEKERQHSNRFSGLAKKVFDSCEPASLMEDFGYSVCSSESQLSKFFLQFPSITESNMARILAMMLRKIGDPIAIQDFEGKLIDKDSKVSLNEWNLDVFASVVKKLNLNWALVIRNLDFAGFEILDENSLGYLLTIYNRITPEPFPLQSIFTEWKESDAQLSIIKWILQVPFEELKISFSQTQQINLQESSHPPPSKPILVNVFSHCWNSLDLIECLLNLATPDRYEIVRSLFEFPIKNLPEILLIGLAQVRPNYINHLHQELTSALIPIFLAMHANSAFVLHRVWSANRNIIIKGMIDMYYADKTTISRLLDIAQDLKALSPILESHSFAFVIDLAALASRREYLFLEKWLQDSIELHKEPFIRACIQYVKEKTQRNTTSGEKATPLISPKVLSAFINCLLNIANSVSQEIQDEIKQLKGSTEFKPHIEEKANEYFKKIYTSQLSIEEAINILKKFKSSKNPDELDIFGCMIHNLFDEYKFFQKYPDRELKITGILFGSLIQHQLVSQTTLRMALKYVLEALKKPVSSKMFKFGLLAIEQFDSRLAEWPTYCNQICYIPHLKQHYPELVSSIENRINALNNPQTLPIPNLPPAPFVPTSEGKSIAIPANVPVQPIPVTSPVAPGKEPILRSSIPIDTLTEFPQEVYKPESDLQDKILFIFNNVSIQNIDLKVKELKTVLTENIYPWLAQYIVVQRASIEANFHSLYLSFLDKLQLQGFIKMCLKSTYHNVKLLLKSDKITTNQSERTLLKNLGSWLGNLTLAKNKPVLRKDLDLKELILEAYEKGRLIAVIPFVARVLDASANSKIFLPPNVWTIALMQFLAEIYKVPRLKMNLKFEIELLCKTLHLDVKDITPTNILKDYKQAPPPSPDIHEGNSPLVKKDKTPVIKIPEPKPSPIATPVPTAVVPTPLSPTSVPQRTITSPPLVPPLPVKLEPEPEENPLRVQIYGAALFTHNPALKKLIAPSIEKAIREIIGPVVERSATIACVSTRELILKDFANEFDDSKIKKAAINMVQNLAGNLALVTCKEPLRINITTHLMTALQGSEMPNVIEDVVQHLTNDNLDMACRIIEKATIEKATISLNESLSVALANRKKGEVPVVNLPRPLPDFLRAKTNGLQAHQLRVYEEFAKAKVPLVQSPGSAPVPQIQSPTRMLPQSRFPEVPDNILTQNQEKVLERLKILVNTIDEYTIRFPQIPLTSIGDEGLILRINQIRSLFTQPNAIEETSSFIVQQLFAHLYEIDGILHRDVYCTLLEGIKSSYPQTVDEITRCYLYLPDNRKLHKDITVRLFQSNLLLRKEFDEHFAELLGDNSKADIIFDFLRYVMQRCIVDLKIPQTEFPRISEVIQKRLRPDDHGHIAKSGEPKQDPMELRKIIVVFFEEWVNIIVTDPNNQTRKAAFLAKIQQQWEEIPQKFFNACTKIAISNFYRQSQRESSESIFITLDCYAKLIVFLWRYYYPDNINHSVRLQFITKILMIIAKYLLKNCESKKLEFNQQPFHRLFNHLFNEMLAPFNAVAAQPADSIADAITSQLLPVFSAILGSLNPCRVIAFSFSWLELISHRLFMSGLLLQKHPKGWQLFQRHLVELFTFLEPYLRNVELTDPIQILYRGTLRVLLVLLHDFPEFLCDYHYSFCDVIPVSCIQMRNLILSAFPRTMRLPEPFTPNLKVDLLPEINQPPRILSNYVANLGRLLPDLDTFLKTRNASFLVDLRSRLLNNPQDALISGSKYNIPQLNALVMHVGMSAINQLQNKGNKGPLAHSPSMDLFQHLAIELDPEGRYLFLNAIVNQLRYPNNHTHYFSCVLLYIFAEAPQEIIQEQITRVLLERLIVNRPHPWGLLITFIELIKNPRYNFWSHNFTRCAPEVERLFESVARSCIIPNKPQNEEQTTAKQ